jgi:hypothetical protein
MSFWSLAVLLGDLIAPPMLTSLLASSSQHSRVTTHEQPKSYFIFLRLTPTIDSNAIIPPISPHCVF